jgi:hypothetical protein
MSLATVTTTTGCGCVSACTSFAVFRQPRIDAFMEAASVVLEVLTLFRRQQVTHLLAKLNAEPSGSGRLCRTPHSVRFDKVKPLAQELKVISDCYDLILYVSQRISKFPRQHRYSLGQSMEQRLQVLLALLIRAKYTSASPEKAGLLRDANIELEVLRFQVRQALDLGAFPRHSHGHCCELIVQVGTQIGGWLKSLSRPAS